MEKTIYLLPHRGTTTSREEYRVAWDKFIEPVVQLTGLKCCGFDPDIRLFSDTGEGVTLPAWFVGRLNSSLESSQQSRWFIVREAIKSIWKSLFGPKTKASGFLDHNAAECEAGGLTGWAV